MRVENESSVSAYEVKYRWIDRSYKVTSWLLMIGWFVGNIFLKRCGTLTHPDLTCKNDRIETLIGNFEMYVLMQFGQFACRIFSSAFFAHSLRLIWRGLDENDTNLQRSLKSLILHLAYLSLFLIFEAINLLAFYRDYHSEDRKRDGISMVLAWTLWSAFELFNRLIMMFCTEAMNKRYEEYIDK